MKSPIFIAVIAAIAGTLIKPIADFIFNYFTYQVSRSKTRNLTGRWRTKWSYISDGTLKEHADEMQINQTLFYVRGQAEDGMHKYIVRARVLPDGIMQGEWRDIQPHTDWYGPFKLYIQPNGTKMIGKWLGKGSDGIRAGDWVWEKM